jgi:hypothetical protein
MLEIIGAELIGEAPQGAKLVFHNSAHENLRKRMLGQSRRRREGGRVITAGRFYTPSSTAPTEYLHPWHY